MSLYKKIYLQTSYFLVSFLLTIFSSNAQDRRTDTLQQRGVVKGLVMDSALNFIINRATVAIYNGKDSSLLNYTLPSEEGIFTITNLPLETDLYLLITHIDYQPLVSRVMLKAKQLIVELGKFYLLQKKINLLEEVVVKSIVPMRFNGDTLEIEPVAFRLDSNATAEDLIRMIPGFTIWADGQLTYNGKEIRSVLVDGKPFFGGNLNVAIKNIPNAAIDKLQLYQTRGSDSNKDSTLQANLKLKPERNSGIFGKLYSGYGTTKRYSNSANLSYFNPLLQISIVGDVNNINNTTNNVIELISRGIYQNAGNDLGYQPNFQREGIYNQSVAGAMLQKDYIQGLANGNEKRVNGIFLFRKSDFNRQSNSITNTVLGTDATQTFKNDALIASRIYKNTASGGYKRNKPGFFEANFTAKWQNTQSIDANVSKTEVSTNIAGLQSTQMIKSELYSNANNINLTGNYQHQLYPSSQGFKKGSLLLEYSLNGTWSSGSQQLNNNFQSLINPAQNLNLSRWYSKMNKNYLNHHIAISLDGLSAYIAPNLLRHGINLSAQTELNLEHSSSNDVVLDLDTLNKKWMRNDYISNNTVKDITDVVPSFTLCKNLSRLLSGRYSRNIEFSFTAKGQYYNFLNQSMKQFQNFSFDYFNFIPNAGITYNITREHIKSLSLKLVYKQVYKYPDVYMIAPLLDSTNLFYQRLGNAYIKPEKDQKISFNLNYNLFKNANHADILLGTSYGWVQNKIADFVHFDNLGRGKYFYINATTEKYIDLTAEIRKKFLKNKNTTLVTLNNRTNFIKSPNYVNGLSAISTTIQIKSGIKVDFDHRNKYNLHVSGWLENSVTKLGSLSNINFMQQNIFITGAGGLIISKRLSWNLNATHNINKLNNQTFINNIIVNSAFTCRFFKANQGELRFSALDILRQNTGFLGRVNSYGQYFSTVNVLQNYYLISFAYYIRKL